MCFSFINSPPLLPQVVYLKVYKIMYFWYTDTSASSGIPKVYDFYILFGIPLWGKSGGELMKEKLINPQNFSTSHRITFDSESF